MTLLNTVLQNDTVKVFVLDNHKTAFEYIKEPNTIIAILAIVVSIIGLWISVRYNRKTLEHTIKHSKLSVEPLIIVSTELSLVKQYVLIEIQNCGIGTAIITKIGFSYKDKPSVNLFKLFIENNYIPDKINASFGYYDENQPVSANSTLSVYKNRIENETAHSECFDFFKELTIYIEYETLYQEKRIYKSLIMKDYN